MDRLLLKKAAVQSIALMVAVVTSSFALQQYQAVSISANGQTQKSNYTSYELAGTDPLMEVSTPLKSDEEQTASKVLPLATNLPELKAQIDEEIKDQLSESFLAIKKSGSDSPSITLEDLYVKHSIQLDLTGLKKDDIDSHSIIRVQGTEFYTGEPQWKEIVTLETDEDGSAKEVVTKDYGKDICHRVEMTTEQDNDTGLYHVSLLLELDSVYAYSIYEDTNYFYIDLKRPSDVYDRIIVIDAGHGGKDAGALSKDKQIYEKNINLGIVRQLKELLDQEDIKVYYTRTGDDTVFLRPRATLANAVNCDYFVSIHCNYNDVTYPNGTEVLYYDNNFKGVTANKLAGLFSEELGRSIGLKSRGTVLKQMGDIFIMDKAQVPTILIELGYLSNTGDLNYLNNPQMHKEIAKGIYNCIIRAYNELPVSK